VTLVGTRAELLGSPPDAHETPDEHFRIPR
jgi:hypothetical protein